MDKKNDELYENIILDKKQKDSYDRYPVRFLFFPLSKNLFLNIISLIQKLSIPITIKKISDYFLENKWSTWEHIFEKIENEIKKSSKDIFFFGLSEYLRLENKNTLETSFINLIGIENTNKNKHEKRRVYFVMDSFEKIFSELVFESHHRSNLYNPIIESDNNEIFSKNKKPELIISLIIKGNENIKKNVKEYLDLCTETDHINFDKKIYCVSDIIYKMSKENTDYLDDSLFPYHVIDNKLSIIESKILGFKGNDSLSEEFIDYLASNIDMDTPSIEFDAYIKEKLLIKSICIETLLYKYFDTVDYNEKKLITLAFEFHEKDNKLFSYLYNLFFNYNIENKKEFINKLYLATDLSIKSIDYSVERKEIINLIFERDGKIEAPENLIILFNTELFNIIKKNIYIDNSLDITIKNVYSQLENMKICEKKINDIYLEYKVNFVNKYLTSKSTCERKIIILLASNSIISDSELEAYYPELYGYLLYNSAFKNKYDFLDDYFLEYKRSKIANNPSNKLKNYYNNITSSNFIDFYNDSNFTNIDNQFNAKNIFVFDGVGAEYISLITYLLEKKYKKNLKIVDYKKALLPTTTDVNKQLINTLKPNPQWIHDFDSEIIHGQLYNLELNLEKAISLIDKMIQEVIEDSKGQSFLIIADHGCTASHKIFKTTKKYNMFTEAEHDGRCCSKFSCENMIKSTDDFIKYKDITNKEWIISIKPTSLNNTAKYEAHGGGTIEEIFVPYIFFENKQKIEKYEINFIKKYVSGIDKSIKFSVSPFVNPEQITIIEETGKISKPFISHDIYICNLSVGKTQKVVICINDIKEEVNVINNSGINLNKGEFF